LRARGAPLPELELLPPPVFSILPFVSWAGQSRLPARCLVTCDVNQGHSGVSKRHPPAVPQQQLHRPLDSNDPGLSLGLPLGPCLQPWNLPPFPLRDNTHSTSRERPGLLSHSHSWSARPAATSHLFAPHWRPCRSMCSRVPMPLPTPQTLLPAAVTLATRHPLRPLPPLQAPPPPPPPHSTLHLQARARPRPCCLTTAPSPAAC
jgi:hypothetical protein